jgi:cytochrome c oxidase subunit 2
VITPGHQPPWTDIWDAANEFYRRILALPPQASSVARKIDALHYFEITVMFAVAAGIAVAALYFVVRYRRRSEEDRPPRVRPSLLFEVTTYGGLLGFFLLVWVIGFAQYVGLAAPPPDAMDVYVTGKQWMWKFSLPDGTASTGVLYVPAGRAVRLLLTSRDVIHSFFVPAFRIKRDAVPGLYTTIWFEAPNPGSYQILCAELCGAGHSQMRGTVEVLPPAQYAAWLRDRMPRGGRTTALAERGRDAAARQGCLRCHTTDGQRHIGPTWLGLYGSRVPLADGTTVVADEAYLTQSMMDPMAQIVATYAPLMPSYQGQLTPPDTAAIVEFIKSLSNTTVAALPSKPTSAAPGGTSP